MPHDYNSGLALSWAARGVFWAALGAIMATLAACDHTLNISSTGTLTRDSQVPVQSSKLP